MIKSMAVFGLTIAALFFLPMDLYITTVLGVYALLIIQEWFVRDVKLLDGAFLVLYGALNVLYHFLGFKDIIPFTGTLFYGALTLVSLAGLILGRPWTLQESRRWQKDLRESHLATAFLMTLGYGLALGLSVGLFPSSSYIWAPLVVTGVTIPLSIFLADPLAEGVWRLVARVFTPPEDRALVRKTFGNLRGFAVSSGTYAAKEVVTPQDRELFFQALCQGYSQIRHREGETPEAFEKGLREEFQIHGARTFAAVVVDTRNGKPVGTVRLVWSSKEGEPLPLESFIPFEREQETRGKVLGEVGRLAILESGPGKARILELLIQLFMVKTLFKRVHTLYTDALASAIPVYKKMGLETLSGPLEDQEFHTVSYLMKLSVPQVLSAGTSPAWERMKSHPWAKKTINSYLKTLGAPA